MKPEHAAILDDLLSRWHSWQQGSRVSRGYDSESAGLGAYRVSRQYDDMNGALDADLDDARSKEVEFAVSEMLHPHRTAIYFEARNLSTGRRVWASPRLPTGGPELDAIVDQARAMLCKKLVDAGVI